DLRPVAVELLGDELGEPSHGALAHLGAGDANGHALVRADHYPGIDLGRGVLRARDARPAEGKLEAERKAAAQGGCARDEAAAIDVRYLIHGSLSVSRARGSGVDCRAHLLVG